MNLDFKVMLLTDWNHPHFLDFIEPLLISGVAVQQRHHQISSRQFFNESKKLNDLCRDKNIPLFINGHLDVALALNCHLHISSHGLSFQSVKHLVSKNKLVSTSIHSLDDISQIQGVHLALAAPVFSPKSKPDDTRAPLGIDGFNQLKNGLSIPLFALGGIDENTAKLLPGVHVFGLLQSLYSHQNPRQLIEQLLSQEGTL